MSIAAYSIPETKLLRKRFALSPSSPISLSISAKAYLSRKICNLIAKHGGRPYISIKKNITKIRAQGSKAWREMLVMHRRSKKLFKKRYHQRSLAETAVSTVKRRFNHMLYSKKRRA